MSDIGAVFGSQLAQSYADILTLQKQVSSQALTIKELAANETRLVDHIQAIEAELSALKAAKVKEDTLARIS